MEDYQYAIEDRVLNFTGYSLAGLPDLTSMGKATGETLWPCSRLLADYLQHDWKTTAATRNVLELGCGLGLCGTVASVRLGNHIETVVRLTDGDTQVLERAKVMSKGNFDTTSDAPVSHGLLQWGDSVEMEKLLIDNGRFQVILASDILYHSQTSPEETATVFAETVNCLLSSCADSHCLVSFQQRDIDMNVLCLAFQRVGFTYRIPTGYYEDIFGQRTDDRTSFTTMFLLCFERAHK